MREDLDNGIILCLKCHDEMHALLSKVPVEYYEEITRLNAKRDAMKSIPKKKRNPSGAKYRVYDEKVPDGAVNDPPEPKASTKTKKAKSPKTRKPSTDPKTPKPRKTPAKKSPRQPASG